jgi:urate oxidase
LYDKGKTILIKYPEGKIDVSFDIPNSVNDIMDYNFNDCLSLASINVTDDNNAYTSQDGVLYNKDKTILIRYPAGKADISLNIPNGVTCIEEVALFNCANLESVTIPDSVTSIDDHAFFGCSRLVSVTFQGKGFNIFSFPADSHEFFVKNEANGTPGTYTKPSGGSEWTKQ